MKEINLEKILLENVAIDRNTTNEEDFNNILLAMKEACKQVLELAVENVCEVEFVETGPMDESVIESITNTINQVK